MNTRLLPALFSAALLSAAVAAPELPEGYEIYHSISADLTAMAGRRPPTQSKARKSRMSTRLTFG